MIVLTREFLVTSFRLVASSQGVVIAAGIWGKLKTVSQMVFSILIMVALPFVEMFSLDFATFSYVSNVLLSITAVLTVVSGIKYIVDGVKVIDINM
jgi:CDP-diacylglycerol--glycerol-3-phosphate 3-phosphatidyltransferase